MYDVPRVCQQASFVRGTLVISYVLAYVRHDVLHIIYLKLENIPVKNCSDTKLGRVLDELIAGPLLQQSQICMTLKKLTFSFEMVW